jgi:hypothetical protein
MQHIEPLRLFDLAIAGTQHRSNSLDEWEELHLADCTQCGEQLELFINIITENNPVDSPRALRRHAGCSDRY